MEAIDFDMIHEAVCHAPAVLAGKANVELVKLRAMQEGAHKPVLEDGEMMHQEWRKIFEANDSGNLNALIETAISTAEEMKISSPEEFSAIVLLVEAATRYLETQEKRPDGLSALKAQLIRNVNLKQVPEFIVADTVNYLAKQGYLNTNKGELRNDRRV